MLYSAIGLLKFIINLRVQWTLHKKSKDPMITSIFWVYSPISRQLVFKIPIRDAFVIATDDFHKQTIKYYKIFKTIVEEIGLQGCLKYFWCVAKIWQCLYFARFARSKYLSSAFHQLRWKSIIHFSLWNHKNRCGFN